MSTQSLMIPLGVTDNTHTSAYYELRNLAHQLATCTAQHIRIYTQSSYLQQNFGRYKTWRDRGWQTSRRKPIKYVDLWKRIAAVCLGKTVDIIDAVQPYRLLIIGSEVISPAMGEYAQRVAQIAADKQWQIVTGHTPGFEEVLIEAAQERGVEVIQPDSLGTALDLADRALCVVSSAHPERDNIVEVLA